MMTLNVRACLTRVTMLLLAALLTAAQAAVFLEAAHERTRRPDTPTSVSGSPIQQLPSWTYGATAARFALIEYADLECPYCASSFTHLRRWIDKHPDVNWQWRHLPLAIHEPRAMQAALRVECIGQSRGNDAFWQAVAKHYDRVRRGLLPPRTDADASPALMTCLRSTRPEAVIRAHMEEAGKLNINATPTLIFQDRHRGTQVRLEGAPSEDVLLSAIDALTVQ